MNGRFLIDFGDSLQNSVLQLLPGSNSDVFEKRSSHLAKQGLGDVKPGAVGRCEHVFKPVGTFGQPGACLSGDMRRMIIQDDPDRTTGRIPDVQLCQQGDEFNAPVTLLDPRNNVPVVQIQRRQG